MTAQGAGQRAWSVAGAASALALLLALAGAPAPARADEASGTAGAAAAERGPVTNLPVPRYVSLKTDEGNVRRGPSIDHRIDWVFRRRNMPLRVTAEFGNWRRVEDSDGQGGWIHYSLLSGVRTVIVQQDATALRARPDGAAPVLALAEAGVVARLGECQSRWCRLSAEGGKGWAEKAALWGVDPDELRD
ncbi:MAG: aspartyl-trna synthetase [Alphaproteobacteria bacterium HGW-Alphaproteobacteria-6]|nr:MAG: aspartyl-trna synthetase [Alphaproteobacteria bacterium HGW-Alphaproteobacteria-6]